MAVPLNGRREEEEEEEWEEEKVEELVVRHPHVQAVLNAVTEGNLTALSTALDRWSGSIDDPIEDGDTVLHLACLYGHLQCVQMILEKGAVLNPEDEEGAIPLHDACAGGFIEIVQLLVNRVNDPNVVKGMLETTDIEGDTPLHHAARGEHLEVVRLLLSLGASPYHMNVLGQTPAELAEAGSAVRAVLEGAAGAAAAYQ